MESIVSLGVGEGGFWFCPISGLPPGCVLPLLSKVRRGLSIAVSLFFRYYTVLICFRFRTTYLTGWVKKKIRELVVEPCWTLRSVPGLAQRDSPELPGDC